MSEDDFGPDDGADFPEGEEDSDLEEEQEELSQDDDFHALTGERLWNIATGEEECDDPKLVLKARKYAALTLRVNGATPYREIAAMLGCSVSTAHGYVMSEVRAHIREKADDIRELHLNRLEAMMAGVMDRATEGDTFAIDSAMKIMTKIEALMGVEPPKRIEITAGGEVKTEEELIAEAERLGLDPTAIGLSRGV